MSQHSISIIIPTLNEEINIENTIRRARNGGETEIIVVDGGSNDNTISKAKKLDCTVLQTEPGRAIQMNVGAKAATGDILLFLHGDTLLPDSYKETIQQTIRQNNVAAGAFRLSIDSTRISARIIAWFANWRSRLLQLPYGDQGLFITKKNFIRVGGFPEMPLMEDYELVRKLRRQGTIITLQTTVQTSDRRWSRLGFWRTTLLNQIIITGYLLGISSDILVRWYRKGRLF